ncbi:MAG: flavin-dependent dehydrogenase, partial [Planctomycetota bacterium]
MKLYKEVDVLIIGAGPSGTVAAAYLKNNDFSVLVVEKQKFPRFVIGESLLPRTLDHLEEVGLLDAVKKVGFQEKVGATFFSEGKKCEFLFAEQFTNGYEYTWQVPRDQFDKVLADSVQEKGVKILFEHAVGNVDFQEKFQLTTITNKDELSIVKSKFIIDASGYGRVLPRQLNLNKPSILKARSAVFTHLKNHFKEDLQQQNNVFIDTLDTFSKAWMWMIPFNNGKTSIG